MYEEAIAEYRKAAEIAPPWKWALGTGYAKAGRLDEARKILAELEQHRVTPWNALWRARLNLALADKDETFRWLNYESPHAWLPWIRVEPDFQPLHGDPRFAGLLRRMNLPPLN